MNAVLRKNIISFLVTLVAVFCQGVWAQGSRGPNHPSVVGRYIRAIQQKNFKTIIDLTYSYQAEVAQIKARNPKVLWPKLIGEYYEQKTARFSKDTDTWGSSFEALRAMMGDPTQAIRAAAGLLPPSCKWRITESRSGTTVYVTVDYPSLPESPVIGKQFLKQTIFEFTVNAKQQLLMGVTRLPKADVYWVKPYPESATSFLQAYYRAQFFTAKIPREARSAIQELLDLGWEYAEPVLLEAVERKAEFLTEAVPPLMERRDEKAVPAIIGILNQKVGGETSGFLCEEETLLLVRALRAIARTGHSEVLEVLKGALSNTLTFICKVRAYITQQEGPPCVKTYLDSLSVLDHPSWRLFPFNSYNMFANDEFMVALDDFERNQGSARVIDKTSATVGNVLGHLKRLSPCSSRGQCLSHHTFDYLKVEGPSTVSLYVRLEESSPDYRSKKELGSFQIVVRTSGDPTMPWVIQNVVQKDQPQVGQRQQFPTEGTTRYESSDFVISYPQDWQEHRIGRAAVFAPRGGLKGEAIRKGVVVDVVDIRPPELSMEDATSWLVQHIIQSSSSLREVSRVNFQVGGKPGLGIKLSGPSSLDGQPETVWVYTTRLGSKLFYAMFISPEAEQNIYQPIFQQLLDSIRFQ